MCRMNLYGFIDWTKLKCRETPRVCGNIRSCSRLRALRAAALFIGIVLTLQSFIRLGLYAWKMVNGATVFDMEWIPWAPLVAVPSNHSCFEMVPEIVLSYFVWIVKNCQEELLEFKKKNRVEGKIKDAEKTEKEGEYKIIVV